MELKILVVTILVVTVRSTLRPIKTVFLAGNRNGEGKAHFTESVDTPLDAHAIDTQLDAVDVPLDAHAIDTQLDAVDVPQDAHEYC